MPYELTKPDQTKPDLDTTRFFDFEHYLAQGESPVTFRKHPLILHWGMLLYCQGGKVLRLNTAATPGFWSMILDNEVTPKEIDAWIKSAKKNNPPLAFLFPATDLTTPLQFDVLLNGDDVHSQQLLRRHNAHAATVSLDCLLRLLNPNRTDQHRTDLAHRLYQQLQDGHVQIKDKTDHQFLPASKNDINRHYKKLHPTPPEPGFTFLASSNQWHRSGTVLVRSRDGAHFLLGQDEGTYFGVQLRDQPDTVDDALLSLIPEQVRGKHYLRQGEWFLTPVDEKDLPKPSQCLATFDVTENDNCFVALPLESDDSKTHRLVLCQGRIDHNGQIYAKDPYLEHDDHATVDATGWYTFFRNTATRSVSQDGVD